MISQPRVRSRGAGNTNPIWYADQTVITAAIASPPHSDQRGGGRSGRGVGAGLIAGAPVMVLTGSGPVARPA